jgi:hypothetical protein
MHILQSLQLLLQDFIGHNPTRALVISRWGEIATITHDLLLRLSSLKLAI